MEVSRCPVTGKAFSTAYKTYKCKCFHCKKYHREQVTKDTRAKERAREWRLKNPEWSRRNAKRYQKEHPDKVFGWQLKKYGLSPDQYYELLKSQGNVCAICKKPEPNTHQYKRLAVDHCHVTNKVRGLLCSHCNTGLGKFRHSKWLLITAATYL